jgi:hypothetical protein
MIAYHITLVPYHRLFCWWAGVRWDVFFGCQFHQCVDLEQCVDRCIVYDTVRSFEEAA